jgi:5-methylcytosine-specific restriction endonuclease McrA
VNTTDFPYDPELVAAVEAAFNRFNIEFVDVPKRWHKAVNKTMGPRVNKAGTVRKSALKKQRLANQYGPTCSYCGAEFSSLEEATLDHVIPAQIVRHSQIWNLVLACEPCNRAKENRIPAVMKPLLTALLYQLATLNAAPVERSLVLVGGVA